MALRGLLAIAFGIVAFVWPGVTMLALVLVFAAYALIDGVLSIVLAVRGARHGERWGLLLLNGILGIAAGIVAVVWPGLTVVVFVLIMAFWAVFSGAVVVAAALDVRVDHGRWWLVLAGLASVIYGAVLFAAPVLGAVVLTWWVGAYALVLGAAMVVMAFRLRMRRGDAPHRVSPARAS
jgi:uncharacterized membrane protein HdeD (DUF308 family)